jgi:hypothetical protein
VTPRLSRCGQLQPGDGRVCTQGHRGWPLPWGSVWELAALSSSKVAAIGGAVPRDLNCQCGVVAASQPHLAPSAPGRRTLHLNNEDTRTHLVATCWSLTPNRPRRVYCGRRCVRECLLWWGVCFVSRRGQTMRLCIDKQTNRQAIFFACFASAKMAKSCCGLHPLIGLAALEPRIFCQICPRTFCLFFSVHNHSLIANLNSAC